MAAAKPERSVSADSTTSFEVIDAEEARRNAPEYRRGKPVYPEIRDPGSVQARLARLGDLLDPKNLAARLGVSVARLRSKTQKRTQSKGGRRRTRKVHKKTRRPRGHKHRGKGRSRRH